MAVRWWVAAARRWRVVGGVGGVGGGAVVVRGPREVWLLAFLDIYSVYGDYRYRIRFVHFF